MRERIYQKLGLVLIIVSCLMWGSVLLIPLSPLSLAQKSLLSTGTILISEAVFWLGILLSGKQLAHQYRQKLNPYYWWQKVGRKKK